MEELLNKLIKKGWKPFGWDDKLSSLHKEYGVGKWYIRFHNGMDSELFDLRQLTSKESLLWQFVWENDMIDIDPNYVKKRVKKIRYVYDENWENYNEYLDDEDYEYRIMQSALCDEDNLGKFLLENIKIS